MTFRIDPAAAEQVSAITDSGATLSTYWESGFVPDTAGARAIRDPAGAVVVADGDDLPVGERLHGYFVCFAPASLYILLTNPTGG